MKRRYYDRKCAVHDNAGNHCPERPIYCLTKDEQEFALCKQCFINFIQINGAFENCEYIGEFKCNHHFIDNVCIYCGDEPE